MSEIKLLPEAGVAGKYISSLKDDNGFYPGVRVAVAFAEENGITTGIMRPGDITLGDMAIILANTDRVFDSAKNE